MALPVYTDTPVATSTASPSKLPSDTELRKVSSLTLNLLVDILVIKALIEKSESTWRVVKEGSPAAKWLLNSVEFTTRHAAKPGRIIAWLFRVPIIIADRALSGRIIEAEKRWPILRESPKKVVEVTMETVRRHMESWYTAAVAVAADGKRTVTASTDFTRMTVSAVQKSMLKFLTNFEDLVDEKATSEAGETRIVEGRSYATSEASGPLPAQPQRLGLVKRALESGLYLYVGGVVCTLSAVPVVARFVRALRERRGPPEGEAGSQQSSRASPTPEQPAPSFRASLSSLSADERE